MANDVSMPKLGFDMAEGTLVNWVKVEGEAVNKGDVIAEIETDKATVEVESPFSGVLLKQVVSAGTTVPVGERIAVIGNPGETIETPVTTSSLPNQPIESPAPVLDDKKSTQPTAAIQEPADWIKASPLARAMANQQGINLQALKGTGPGGRIIRRDVEAHITNQGVLSTQRSKPLNLAEKRSDYDIPLTRLRSAIGKRMTESKQNLPHFYVTRAFDVATLIKMRADVNARKPDENKLSINDFIVKAVGLTLAEMPELNASLSENAIHVKGNINVGVAVATDDGLLTIVCRDADTKPIEEISAELKNMALRVREGKVKPDDIEGSTFTISNLGMFDVEHFAAIINPPEAAILAVGSAHQVPVVEDGVVKPGWRMRATLSADHRLIDGAQAARFMQALAGYLEQPWRLM